MQLPSATDLVRAFVTDLGNVLDVNFAGDRPTVQKSLWCGSSTATLTADRDYVIVAVAPLTVGAWVLAATPTTVAQLNIGNGTSFDVIAAVQSVSAFANANFYKMRWRWIAGTKIYLVSTAGTGIILTLEI